MTGSGDAAATASPAAELFYFRRSVASNEKINGSSLAPLIIQMNSGTQDNYRELEDASLDCFEPRSFDSHGRRIEKFFQSTASSETDNSWMVGFAEAVSPLIVPEI